MGVQGGVVPRGYYFTILKEVGMGVDFGKKKKYEHFKINKYNQYKMG